MTSNFIPDISNFLDKVLDMSAEGTVASSLTTNNSDSQAATLLTSEANGIDHRSSNLTKD